MSRLDVKWSVLGEVAANLAKRICDMEEYTAALEEKAVEVHRQRIYMSWGGT